LDPDSAPEPGRLPVPLLIWDGECGFCRRSVEHLRAWLGARVAYEPYQSAHVRFSAIPKDAFRAAVHLIEPDGRATRGAEAVFRALAHGRARTLALPLAVYRFVPGFAGLTEWAYRQVAEHRPLASRLLELLVGDLVGPPQFRLTRFVFLRLLAFSYLAAFLSLGSQVHGLVGERGLLPAGELLRAVHEARGGLAYWLLPTLGWLGAGDTALGVLCYGGAVAALLALLGFAQGPLLAVCWAFYLSLVHLGQDFLSFQWDILLVETGFIALMLAPWAQLRPRLPRDEPKPPTAAIWLLRLLLFKLMFSSGLTKLTWGDPTWRDWSALTYHYWTQPIPTPLAWYANQLPRALQAFSCAVMYVIELGLPFLIAAPRRPRRVALYGFLTLQALIAATGNYGFFNLLAVVLCVPLLDDRSWPAALRKLTLGPELPGQPSAACGVTDAQPQDRPPQDQERPTQERPDPAAATGDTAGWELRPAKDAEPAAARRAAVMLLATFVALLSIPPLVDIFHTGYWSRHRGHPLLRLSAITSPFLLSSSYGLFRTMTTTRPEIQIEVSDDSQTWREIAFRYKPGDPARAPRFFPPHMPRLDWQMWFAALGAERVLGDPVATRAWLTGKEFWLQRLLVAILRGEPQILELLEPPPFGKTPPRYVRLVLWQYRFTDGGQDWWQRRRTGVLLGPLSFSQPAQSADSRPDTLQTPAVDSRVARSSQPRQEVTR
jgi:predicted DCC family thiol-disulfide oxidoreductase YuxK